MISPTWGEYLGQMSNYVLALRRGIQLGSASIIEVPTRPTDPIAEKYRDEAARLSDACNQLMVEVIARMNTISTRSLSTVKSPHQEPRIASYLETDM